MPKSLLLGNGSFLVGYDDHGQVKDFYYEYVGLDNQLTEEAVNHVGVWVDGAFSWLSDPAWSVNIDYEDETFTGRVVAVNHDLSLSITFIDVVYNETNIYIRRATVDNLADNGRTVRLFFNHQFRMYGVKKKDTVYYDPIDQTIIHYKGRRIALIAGMCDEGKAFDDYTVGLSSILGKEGTWRDAEDGELSKNAIEHGTVDSTIGFSKTVDAKGQFYVDVWVCIGKTLEEAKDLSAYVKKKTPEYLIESTSDFWHAWVNKSNFSFHGMSEKAIVLFKKSLLVARAHVDNNGGIIASADSDMLKYGKDDYNYVWTRDGAFVAMAMDKAGYFEVSKRFFTYCNDVITNDGYFFHKYRPDKALGSSWHAWISREGELQLPIQEDETALVIIALYLHYNYTKDLEFIEGVYNSLIKKASNFMLGFRDEHGLPQPTYDLWEEKYGIHTFTAASVYGALKSAAAFAKLLGKDRDEKLYSTGAEQLKTAILKNLYNKDKKYFYKGVSFVDGKMIHDEAIDASSFFGVYRFGILGIDELILKDAFDVLQSELICGGNVGGVCRYVGDDYYEVSAKIPGNPWIITTLWMVQYYIQIAKNEQDLEIVKQWLDWTADRATGAGMLAEQYNPYTGEQLSASPLAWSHGTYIETVISYMEKLEEFGVCPVCYPSET
jgi:GH15 family glucan-1,4-alpha-glucosidase